MQLFSLTISFEIQTNTQTLLHINKHDNRNGDSGVFIRIYNFLNVYLYTYYERI